jgi:hypothetical protein
MQVVDKIEQCQEGGRKRTGVDCKHDDRNHQDDLTLVRAQYPSPPNNDAVGDKKLNRDSKGCISLQGILMDDIRRPVLCTVLTLTRGISPNKFDRCHGTR